MKITKAEDVKREEIEEFKKTYFEQIKKHTPTKIRELKIFDLDNPDSFKIKLDADKIQEWNVKEWLANYKKEALVSTAGIRGVQNVLYPQDYRYPLNELGIGLATLGKARVLKKKIKDRVIQKICSGEVRYNTNRYMEIIQRTQAAQGIKTHLPMYNAKTSIWMTSFLIFKSLILHHQITTIFDIFQYQLCIIPQLASQQIGIWTDYDNIVYTKVSMGQLTV